MGKPRSSSQVYVVAALLALVTICAYWHVLHSGFTNFDDDQYVTANPHVRSGITLKSIAWAFNVGYAGNWHPLTWISHMADWRLFGANPVGHHAVNLALHVLNTLLLLVVLRRMTGSLWRSAFVSALFAVHPLHVESVAWIAERKDVLSTLFWLLTMWAYARYARSPSAGLFLPIAVFFALGLMSKPTLVTLPFVLLLLDYWPLGRWSGSRRWCLIREKIPLIVMSAASCVVTYWAQHNSGAVSGMGELSAYGRFANAALAYLAYMWKMFWPTGLCAYYPHQVGIPVWHTLARVALLGGATILVVRAARRRPYLLVGWLWYLGVLAPMIGIVQVGGQGMADRYTYVPLIGLFVMVSWGVLGGVGVWEFGSLGASERGSVGGQKSPTRPFTHSLIPVVIACSVVVTLAVGTWRQVGYWHDSVRLFRRALAVTTNNSIAHNNLGMALDALGKRDEATSEFHEALNIDPKYADAHNNLGASLAEKGGIREATAEFDQAVRLNPRFAQAHANLARALARQGRLPEAVEHYRRSLEIAPEDPRALEALGSLYDRLGSGGDAIDCYSKAVAIRPDDADTRYLLAVALAKRGDLDEALRQFALVLKAMPDSPKAHYGMAVAYAQRGDVRQAIAQFSEVIRLDPKNPRAHEQLAIALYFRGDYALAWREVRLARTCGARVNTGFLKALSSKMPEPPY